MNQRELESLAARLGILTSYVDVDDRRRTASNGAVRAAVEILTDGGAEPEELVAFEDVVLIRGSRWRSGVAASFAASAQVTVVLEDGSTIDVPAVTGAVDLQRRLPAAELPRGMHTLRWETGGRPRQSALIVAPARFPAEARAQPGLAVFTPAYAIWSDDLPLPSYDGLDRLGQAVAGLGVDTIATLPLYSPGFGHRFDPSPYSPASRFHWNELYVPGRRLHDDGGHQFAGASTVLDWATTEQLCRRRLDATAADLDDHQQASLDTFLAARPDVASFAQWAAAGDPVAVRRHEVGQWLAEESLAEVAAKLAARGQTLALDLPVGARTNSWETVRWPELFIAGVAIGAPPDSFFAEGQNWGLPPLNPAASRRTGHRVWYELLLQASRFAGVLRIDHVMQVFRLWWVPGGHRADDGVYVRYPAEELLAVAAIVAETTGTTMVGEDLGTVAPEVRRLLDDWGLIGMHEEGFVLHGWAGDGNEADEALPPIVSRSWAGIRTHDMAPLAAIASELDTGPYRDAIGASLGHVPGPAPDELATAMVTRLRRSDAYEVVVDIDDVLGLTTPHNIPGVIDDANWSHRLPIPVEAIADDPRMARVLTGRGAMLASAEPSQDERGS